MKFSEYPYKRVDFVSVSGEIFKLKEKLEKASSFKEQQAVIDEYFKINSDVETNVNICSIRNTINQNDKFYEDEINFINESYPILINACVEFNKSILNSKFLDDIKKTYSEFWVNKLEKSLKTYNPIIDDLLVKESNLALEYNKLIANCKIEYKGSIHNLSQMGKYFNSLDRNTRKEAAVLVNNFYKDNESEIDRIYDDLVHTRSEMAKRLGYPSYIELGYDRLGRTDYDQNMVATYRKAILDKVVPYTKVIFERQREMLGYDKLEAYDLPIEFLDGNPTPKGNKDELVLVAKDMYSKMSKETKDFFNYMVDNELMDLETKPGKSGGGYCSFIPNYKSPFIFSNFNQTKGDVDVLTHEAGHAFQVYLASRGVSNPDLFWPTYEAAEIHSMSMEFLAYPYIEGFFKEDTNKYKKSHLADAFCFLPYGALIDHFQHEVYKNPDLTPDDRKKVFRDLEKMYLPHKNYTDQPMYEKGCFWFKQGHVFSSPFYYIDYTLAQVCAFDFYTKSQEDYNKTFKTYLELCKLGGTKSFLGLVISVGIINPFVTSDFSALIDKIISKIEDNHKNLK